MLHTKRNYRYELLPETVMKNLVERIEDMSPTGRLQLFKQPDGDVIIQITTGETEHDFEQASVEFCAIAFGGGRSPHTLEALRKLYDAMELDNKENPITPFPQRAQC